MSAPKVGDRVRVIAGQWTGWEGVVTGASSPPYLWVDFDISPVSVLTWTHFERTIPADEVETVPTTPENAPVSDRGGSDGREDAGDAHGATESVER